MSRVREGMAKNVKGTFLVLQLAARCIKLVFGLVYLGFIYTRGLDKRKIFVQILCLLQLYSDHFFHCVLVFAPPSNAATFIKHT